MATVVLSAVGTIIGGPIGGAIGALAGSFVDNTVLGSGGGRVGPRLQELDVQTSSYGSTIPAVFGKMRVAGTVIWATDLQESRNREGGGKGRPSVTSFSYSVSLAVAISSRPILRIGRIWADGNLMRGAADDFKVQTDFRLYDGNGDQHVDPLIASDVGLENCSAYRGMAYAVFEDLQLADYGNRIPQITFEVIECEDEVPIHDIVRDTSNAIVGGEGSASVVGYAVDGTDIRSSLEPIFEVAPVSVFPDGDRLLLSEWSSGAQAINPVAVRQDNGRETERPKTSYQRANDLPKSITLRHYEPIRDYQLGAQQSDRAGPGYIRERLDLPASLTAETAKNYADIKLLDLQRGRSSLEGNYIAPAADLSPGSWILGENDTNLFRIQETEYFKGYSLCRSQGAIDQFVLHPSSFASGAHIPPSDYPVGETALVTMELPNLTANAADVPIVAVAASGTQPGWAGANLAIRQGSNLVDIGRTAGSATIGHLLSTVGSHTPLLIDEANHIEIELLHEEMEIPPAYGDPTVSNAPAVWINGEIFRFGHAEPVGDKSYRLGRLMRGAFASDTQIAEHPVSSTAVFLEESALKFLGADMAMPGADLIIEALGLGDDQPVVSSLQVSGVALRPNAPVHGRLVVFGDGSREIGWARRPRVNAGWQDAAEQPLSEDFEAYLIEIHQAGQTVFQGETANSKVAFTANEWVAFGLDMSAAVNVEVRQSGKYGVSEALSFSV